MKHNSFNSLNNRLICSNTYPYTFYKHFYYKLHKWDKKGIEYCDNGLIKEEFLQVRKLNNKASSFINIPGLSIKLKYN